MKPKDPDCVKFFFGILYNIEETRQTATEWLTQRFGKIDHMSPVFDFHHTDFYQEEMGSSLFRVFISFEKLINPKEIAPIKIITNSIEDQLLAGENRTVNIDPGYMDYHKVVLASAKYNSQKIYLDQGIYADPTLWYEKGSFHPYPYAFPDFKTRAYTQTFLQIRTLYKAARKEGE